MIAPELRQIAPHLIVVVISMMASFFETLEIGYQLHAVGIDVLEHFTVLMDYLFVKKQHSAREYLKIRDLDNTTANWTKELPTQINRKQFEERESHSDKTVHFSEFAVHILEKAQEMDTTCAHTDKTTANSDFKIPARKKTTRTSFI